jgi:hypothetical protein
MPVRFEQVNLSHSPATSVWDGMNGNLPGSAAGAERKRAPESQDFGRGKARDNDGLPDRERLEMVLDAKRAQLAKMQQLSQVRFLKLFISRSYLDELGHEVRAYELMVAGLSEQPLKAPIPFRRAG